MFPGHKLIKNSSVVSYKFALSINQCLICLLSLQISSSTVIIENWLEGRASGFRMVSCSRILFSFPGKVKIFEIFVHPSEDDLFRLSNSTTVFCDITMIFIVRR